jgi:alpha-galactosidase
VFFLASVARSEVSGTGRLLFRDLDPDVVYRVDPLTVGDQHDVQAPAWWSGARTFSGRSLGVVGVQPPLVPADCVVPFRLTAV